MTCKCRVEKYEALQWAWKVAKDNEATETAESIKHQLSLLADGDDIDFHKLLEERKRGLM